MSNVSFIVPTHSVDFDAVTTQSVAFATSYVYAPDWILASGLWDDLGIWFDTEVWID